MTVDDVLTFRSLNFVKFLEYQGAIKDVYVM